VEKRAEGNEKLRSQLFTLCWPEKAISGALGFREGKGSIKYHPGSNRGETKEGKGSRKEGQRGGRFFMLEKKAGFRISRRCFPWGEGERLHTLLEKRLRKSITGRTNVGGENACYGVGKSLYLLC